MKYDPKFTRAVKCFSLEMLARQKLSDMLYRARKNYGVAGNILSGGHYGHWPEDEKQKVRRLNRVINRLSDAGFRARPSRVQMYTMRTLRGSVQTAIIQYQHGSLSSMP